MFQQAVARSMSFTKPVITYLRRNNGAVQTGCAAFVLLNPDGWVVSAAHVLDAKLTADKDRLELQARDKRIQEIQVDPMLSEKRKPGLIKQVPSKPDWITTCSYWWSVDGMILTNVAMNPAADLMVGQLQPFQPDPGAVYPVLGNSTKSPIAPGAMLCRLGFPFHEVKATWNVTTSTFDTDPLTFPIPFFPYEGMYTRQAILSAGPGAQAATFLEMSSPGLRGQSGGPIFDSDGVVWAIQSRTLSLPLGFQPSVHGTAKPVVEHQFINLGLGGYVDELREMLDTLNVRYDGA